MKGLEDYVDIDTTKTTLRELLNCAAELQADVYEDGDDIDMQDDDQYAADEFRRKIVELFRIDLIGDDVRYWIDERAEEIYKERHSKVAD